jgi:hypothetical protein
MFLRGLGTFIPNYTASQPQTSNEIFLKERKTEHVIKMGETLNAHKILVRTRSMYFENQEEIVRIKLRRILG